MYSKMVHTEKGTMREKLPNDIDFAQVKKISKEKWYHPNNDYTVPPELLDTNSCRPKFVLWNGPEGLTVTEIVGDESLQHLTEKDMGEERFQEIVSEIEWER